MRRRARLETRRDLAHVANRIPLLVDLEGLERDRGAQGVGAVCVAVTEVADLDRGIGDGLIDLRR